ncbi:MAG: SDR family oxidoreductase [Prevotellaceae bacterium]|jgi:short-subunit dehydrogenase|nr:SDR family oxidoreductase [Prevotellaceae bacterium]
MGKFSLQDKVVVITGASSGIGMACAKEFVDRGAKVMMAARNIEKLEQLAGELKQAETTVSTCQTDVSDENDCKKLIQSTINTFGAIDVLINNAGVSMRAAFQQVDLSVLKRLMDVNFWGTVYCTKHALAYLLNAKGSVVGVSSVAGLHGLPGRTGYSSSKYAIQGFLDTLRIETLKKELHVMVAIPGFTASNVRFSALTADGSQQGETPRNEEKMMSAEEVAKRIANGIEQRKRTLAMTYEGKLTPILKLLFPKWLDKMYYNHMKKEPNSPI